MEMEMHQLLEMLGDNVKIKLIDKDNAEIGNYDLENTEDYFYIKENHFKRIINKFEVKDNMLVVRLKKYSKFEHKTIKELQEMNIYKSWNFLHSVFFELDQGDLRVKERHKEEILSYKGRQNLKMLSKPYYDGECSVVLVVLQNGEWFEAKTPLWVSRWTIKTPGGEHDKEYYEQYMNK